MLEEYRKRIFEETEFVRLEGILPSGAKEVPLDKVYIQLHAISERRRETLREAERDQLKEAIKDIPARSQEDYFAFIQRLGDFYYYQPGSRLYPSEGESIDPEDALKKNPRMVILGAPGSGKSTFLRFLARRCASDPGGPIPIMLSLRKYAEHLGNGGEMSLQDFGLKDQGRFEPQLRSAIEDGDEILWLLDGLDEARGWQGDIRHSVRDIPGDLVLTSRPVGYSREGLEKLPHFEVLPLSPDDTDKFLRDWFGHLSEQLGKPGNWTEARVKWLKEQLSRKKGIEPLARNPLLLTFLVILAGQDPLVELPERRSQIFEKYVQKLLLSWEDRRLPRQGPAGETSLKIGPFEGSQAQDILLRGFHWIGWFLHLSYYSGCSENVCGSISYMPFREDLEEYLKERLVAEEGLKDSQAKVAANDIADFWHGAGILDVWALEGQEYLAFRHLAFQEYASASVLLDIWRKDPGRAWSFLEPRLHHRAWQQPILLIAGKMEAKEIDSLLKRIRNNHGLWQEALLLLLGGLGKSSPAAIWRMLARGGPYERILHLDLRLCLDVINECGYAGRSWKSQSADLILGQAVEVAVNGITWIHPFRNHLLGRNMPIIGPLLDHSGEMKQIFYSSLLPLLKYPEPQLRASATFALGYLGNAQAVPDLTALLKDSDWMVQILAAEALDKLGDVQAVPDLLALLKDTDQWVQSSAAEALGKLGDVQAVPDLIALLMDSDFGVQSKIFTGIHTGTLLIDSDLRVRGSAAEALGKLNDAQVVPDLLALLKDSDSWVRWSAAEALGKLGDTQAVPDLLSLLKDSESGVRRSAAEALGKLGDTQAVPHLLALLMDSNIWVRSSAAEALGKLGDTQAVPYLLAILKDSNIWMQSTAAEALRNFEGIQRDPSMLILFGHLMLKHSLANIKQKEYAGSMSLAIEYVALHSANLVLKEVPLRDPLYQQSSWSDLLDSLSISLGPLGINVEKLKQWLRNK
ncbi:MAG: NACHT domain-containing protein [Methanothrix sp.]